MTFMALQGGFFYDVIEWVTAFLYFVICSAILELVTVIVVMVFLADTFVQNNLPI